MTAGRAPYLVAEPNLQLALFTGAGLSSGPPACLPTGQTFHQLLRDACESGARALAPDVVDARVLSAAQGGNWNLLARIENACPGAGRAAVAAMRVTVPNEEHLLAAIHLARGGYHVTVNFDDGIETAYALLSGRATLRVDAPEAGRRALSEWVARFPRPAPELRVISRPREFAARTLSDRPLLVKVHGSLGHPDGIALSLPGFSDEPDVTDVGQDRDAAFEELVRHPFVLVTGFSAGDIAASHPLIGGLRAGSFAWVAPDVRPDVRSRLEAIDSRQPLAGYAADALRELLLPDAPHWPAEGWVSPAFEDRFAGWLATLPPTVAAETFAWLLADSGLTDEAIELLGRVVRAGGGPGTRIRLADALMTRAAPGDLGAARRVLVGAARGSDPRVRGPAVARLVRTGAQRDGRGRRDRNGPLPQGAAMAAALAATIYAGAPGRARATEQLAGLILARVEGEVRSALHSPVRRHVVLAANAVTFRLVGRALARSAAVPSGRWRARLRRQSLELAAIDALLGRRPVPANALASAERILDELNHVTDRRGAADALATQALTLLAIGQSGRALETFAQARTMGVSPHLESMLGALLVSPRRTSNVVTREVSRRRVFPRFRARVGGVGGGVVYRLLRHIVFGPLE